MTHSRAFWMAKTYGPSKDLEDIIATSSYHSYLYAQFILKGPFPAGEVAISTNAATSYAYSREVLKGPFPAGEDAIAKESHFSFFYARDILSGPFPKGEKSIAEKPNHYYEYAFDILKGPFPEAEPKMLEDFHCNKWKSDKELIHYHFRFNRDICPVEVIRRYPAYSLSYAIMKNSRFPEGEPAMKRSPRIWKRYQEFLDDTNCSVYFSW